MASLRLLALLVLLPPSGAVTSKGPTRVAPGERTELSFTIQDPVDRRLPLLVRLFAPPELGLLDNRLGWPDVADPAAERPRVVVPLTAPARAGTYRVRGTVTYWICPSERCVELRASLVWDVNVSAP